VGNQVSRNSLTTKEWLQEKVKGATGRRIHYATEASVRDVGRKGGRSKASKKNLQPDKPPVWRSCKKIADIKRKMEELNAERSKLLGDTWTEMGVLLDWT